MATYRILKHDNYNSISFSVEKRLFGIWWCARESHFETIHHATAWVAEQGFIKTKSVVKEIRV